MTSSRAEPTGLLRVNASFGIGSAHIAPAVSRFVALHPRIQIQLLLTDRPLIFQEAGFDLGIRFGEVPDARINTRLLLPNRRVVCASPEYLKRHGAPVLPHDLTRHTCLVLRENESAYGTWHFTRGKKTETVKVDGQLSSNDGGVVLQWALDGRRIAVRSLWEVGEPLSAGQLVELLPAWTLPNADIHAIYLERHRLSAKLRTFIDFLVDELSSDTRP